jgi:hypothetical protein
MNTPGSTTGSIASVTGVEQRLLNQISALTLDNCRAGAMLDQARAVIQKQAAEIEMLKAEVEKSKVASGHPAVANQ